MAALRILGLLAALYGVLLAFVYWGQRRLLYFPSHDNRATQLTPWVVDGRVIGYCAERADPREVWLMLHGNGGQASQRGYALERMPPNASLYVLEYPGFGQRMGEPSQSTINAAALEAYATLRNMHPALPVGVLGESIGSGPACMLAQDDNPPDKVVLVVPFDRLTRVAARHFRFLPAGWLLRDRWDNVSALQGYRGSVVIFGASQDEIIPIGHARELAAKVPEARLIEIPGGHNDWSYQESVKVRF